MKCTVLRSALRVVGWGDLPEIGAPIELPDPLARQLIEQRIVAPAPAGKDKRAPRTGAAADEETR